jgi:UDP-glucose 4-epimerase
MDLADAHILALEALRDGRSRAYNVGIGRGYTVKEVIDVARAVTGHAIPTQTGGRRAGDAAALVADNTRIMEELNWMPQYNDLRPIIETAWKWHQSHPNGYNDADRA